jgi:hypothetical protein
MVVSTIVVGGVMVVFRHAIVVALVYVFVDGSVVMVVVCERQ